MNPQEFFRAYLPYARSVSEQTGIDPRLVLAQAALETGYGRSAPDYNFFGIKGRGQTQQTKEFRNGQWVTENAGFRSYSDPSGSFADYADLMMNSARYEPVRAGRTLEEQIAAMASSGYATDPDYGAKLAGIAGMIDYNSPELIGADAMRALGRDTGAIPVTLRRTANAGNTTGTEAPMGLLNMGQPAGQQAPAQAQGNGFWNDFAGGILADPDRRARLAMAFEGMSLNPNQSVIALAQSNITDRKTKATLNRTIEWLRGQPNGEAYIRMIEAGASPAQVVQAMMTEQRGDNVVVGGNVVNRQTGEVIYSAPVSADPQSAIAKLALDLKNGNITQDQYDLAVANMAPSGMSVEVGPDGTVKLVQGAGAGMPKLTEGQATATGFFARASASDQILRDLEREGTGLYNAITSNIPIAGNYMVSEEYQRYNQAKRDFINAILRQESGAAIGPSEFANAEQQYFPQPGDGPQVIEQKRQNRETAIAALKVASGAGAAAISPDQSTSAPASSDGFSVTGQVGG